MLDNGAKDGSLVTEEEEVVAVFGKHLYMKNKY